MANLIQQPNEWNVAYVPNVYSLNDLGDDGAGNPNTKFAITVRIGGVDVATFTQPANPAGAAHFDVSKVLQTYLEPAFVQTTEFASETPKETLTYQVEYGVINYQGQFVFDGSSAVKHVINGYDNWRTLNWDDSNYQFTGTEVLCETTGNNANMRGANFLTNYPKDAYPLRSSAYHTLSFFNRMENHADGTLWDGTVIAPAFVRVKFYTATNSLIQTSIYSINATKGLGPRATFDANTLAVYTDDQLVGTIGAGPQNLKDAGIWPTNGVQAPIWGAVTQTFGSNTNIWNLGGTAGAVVGYYTVEVMSIDQCYWNANGAPADEQATTLQNYLGDTIYEWRFNVEDPCTNFDPITVSFINQYGVADYFTFDRRNTNTLTINRNNYNQSLGSWSDATFSIDQHGRGRRTFSTDITQELMLSSYWMTDEESKWLEELFTSPHVHVYVDGQWEPAVISSNTYEQKTYARDRMFQHTLMVQYSNDKKVQRG